MGFSFKCFKISWRQTESVACIRAYQLNAHDVLSYTGSCHDHSLWNLGATKKYKNCGSSLLWVRARVVFHMQWGSFKSIFDRFNSCWNASDSRKYILSTITDLYFFWLIKFFVNIFRCPKRRSKVQKTNTSCKHILNFDQWKTFPENYKPMRVSLWLVYKFTENYYPSRLFSEFIQTQKRYPYKVRILTWKLLVISS